jgi:peptide/nickel transport system ATP-binding protein
MTAPPAIARVEDVSLAYDGGDRPVLALGHVSVTIGPGEALGLVGESGCGKSTLAYLLLGYVRRGGRVIGGRVEVTGRDLLHLDRRDLATLRGRRIGFVPQNPASALSPGMRVGEQVAEVLRAHRVSPTRAAATTRVAELLAAVGLPDPPRTARRYPHQLSGGQQQRIVIAMALACTPDLVVLDEPTTGLDVTTQAQIVALLNDLRQRTHAALLYVSHDLGLLAQIADRIGVMYAGRLVELAETAELFRRPAHPYTRGLLGSLPRLTAAGVRLDRLLRGYFRLADLPDGCSFAPRCDFAEPACFAEPQSLAAISPRHLVACRRSAALPAAGDVSAPPAGLARAMDGQPPLLSIEGVSLAYRVPRLLGGWLGGHPPRAVVRDLTLHIGAGETFALVGESGSGKSTIARAVSGLLAPETGRITFHGVPLPTRVAHRSLALRRQIQYIFQNPDASLNPRARVGEILGRPLALFFGLSGSDARTAVGAALGDVQLDASYARRFADELSGGERQRIAIARALVARPELLVCDEILSALDVSVQAGVLALLRQLKQERGLTMLFIAHDLSVVRAVADRVGVLYGGQLLEIGTAEAVFAPPYHPYTHLLLSAIPAPGRPPLRLASREGAPLGSAGCPFAGRCPWQPGSLCDEVPPPWREIGASQIRCHLPVADLAARAHDHPVLPSPAEKSTA